MSALALPCLSGLFLLLGGIFFSGVALAQTAETDLCHQLTARCDTDSVEIKTLYLDVDALAFFKDNEFDGNIAKGMLMLLLSSKTTSSMATLPKDTPSLECALLRISLIDLYPI